MNQDASPGLTVRAEAGLSALALSRLAGDLLGRRAGSGGHRNVPGTQEHQGSRPAQVTYSWPLDPSAIASFLSPVGAGPTSTAPVLALNWEPWHGQMISFCAGS